MDFKHLLDTSVDKKELVNPLNDIPIPIARLFDYTNYLSLL